MSRPHKRRHGARVLVVASDEVLFVRDRDPGVPGFVWWTLPGGGLDPGEDAREGASRELLEETGLLVPPDGLVGPIATRVVTHRYSDRILIQDEVFFRVDVERFDPVPVALSDSEITRQISLEWLRVDQLDDYRTWPVAIAELLAATPTSPIDWGEVDESSTL